MRPRSLFAVLASAVAPFAFAPGCGRGGDAPSAAPAASAPPASPAALASAAASAGEDEVRPVYPPLQGEPDPAARRLCAALHELPARGKAACCQGGGSHVGGLCEGVVTAALRSGAVSLESAALDRCVEAMERAHQGCDWVTPLSSPVPPECESVLRGKLAEGDKCRSSVECEGGLRCHGAGPTSAGRCGRPREGGACNAAVDVLATYARQDGLDRAHPECAGRCAQHRCQPALAAGEACAANASCGPGARCSKGRCVARAPGAEGEACEGALDCAAGLHCARGACRAKGGEGEACGRDADCRGACLKEKGRPRGVCGHRCSYAARSTPAR